MNVSLRLPLCSAAALLLLLPATGCNRLKARDQLNKGVQAYKSARFEEAVDHFQTAISLDPSLKTAKLYLATAYASQVVPDVKTADNIKNANNAINLFQEVLQESPKGVDIPSLKGIGALYLEIDQPDKAKEYQQKVIDAKPTDAEAHYTIGVIDWKTAYNNAIPVRNKLGQQDDGSAIKDKKACAELAAQNGPIVDEGIDNLQKAIANRADYSDAMAYLNLLYRRKAELECGNDDARKADSAQADEWVKKAMDAKKNEAAKKASNASGGITIDPDK
jgi:tetratricopeptide (TPR) repeat protein